MTPWFRTYARTLKPEKPGRDKATNLDVLVAFTLGLALALVWGSSFGWPF